MLEETFNSTVDLRGRGGALVMTGHGVIDKFVSVFLGKNEKKNPHDILKHT